MNKDTKTEEAKNQQGKDGQKPRTPEEEKASGKSEDASEEKTVTLKESEHRKLLEELAEAKDKYVRLYAEFDNARKRMEREKAEFVKYASGEILAEFLNILDDLERSIEAAKGNHEDYQAFLKGMEMVMAKVYEVLKKNDVTPIDAKGKPFDPNSHEILMQEESDEYDEGVVIEEFQKGYKLGDRVLRTSKVKVAKQKT